MKRVNVKRPQAHFKLKLCSHHRSPGCWFRLQGRGHVVPENDLAQNKGQREPSPGCVAFTPNGQYLWYDSIFSADLRVWRCADWVELDAYRLRDKHFPTNSFYNTAEWIVLRRDAPFEAEPTDWLERGPYEPDLSDSDWPPPLLDGEVSVVEIVVESIGVLNAIRAERDDGPTRAERRRHRRQLPRRPAWDE